MLLIIEYLKDESLPIDASQACKVILQSKYCAMLDGILHHGSGNSSSKKLMMAGFQGILQKSVVAPLPVLVATHEGRY